MTERRRKFWGWGYDDEVLPPALIERTSALLQMGFGLETLTPTPPPRAEAIRLRAPRFALPPSLTAFCTDAHYDRLSHSYGKAYRDIMRGLRGQFDHPPDYVAYPHTDDHIQQIMTFCASNSIALIPYGGGSSVVGGVEPTTDSRYVGVIALDLKHFNQVLAIDPVSRSIRAQGGIYGPALEAALKLHGLTLRHFPQSFEFSTLGGWIATRAGGHFATLYTHIDDFVQSVRMITPSGVMQTRRLPNSGAGPQPERLIMGSEGAFGVITEAWLRVQQVPTHRAAAAVRFADESAAIEAVRAISQAGLYPSNCRLISAFEAFNSGLGDGGHTVLLLAFESADHSVEAWMARGLDICKKYDGLWDEIAAGARRSAPADEWRASFIKAPYLRDYLAQCGLILETFETAITWDQFAVFHQAVLDSAQNALNTHCGAGVITWRFTHVYPDGPAPYYTVMALGKRDHELEQWDTIKTAVSTAIIAHGGTITHHHAVGKDHRRWYEMERSPLFGAALSAVKNAFDPAGIMNPGTLLVHP